MTTTTSSRRERLRAETGAEIKNSARRLLVAGGPTAISLRAIARDLGMTAPALYRYFPSLDALILAVVTDLFEDLRATVADAAIHHGDQQPLVRVGHMARAFRRWSLDRPAEFALMFGIPLNDAGARFGATFFTVLGEHYVRHPFGGEAPDLPDPALRELFKPYLDTFGDRFPLPVIYLFVAAWTRLYGIVAMEVFGHLRWAMTDVEPLFEVELARTVSRLAR